MTKLISDYGVSMNRGVLREEMTVSHLVYNPWLFLPFPGDETETDVADVQNQSGNSFLLSKKRIPFGKKIKNKKIHR